MYFLIVVFIGVYLGYKLRGFIEIYRQVKNIKTIKYVVEKVLNNEEIKIINDKVKNKNDNINLSEV